MGKASLYDNAVKRKKALKTDKALQDKINKDEYYEPKIFNGKKWWRAEKIEKPKGK